MNFDFSDLEQGFAKFEGSAEAKMYAVAKVGAVEMERYAKSHHKWENRTGDAERTFWGKANKIPIGYRLTIGHGVDYGKWLELANEKRFAIIPDTLHYCGVEKVVPAFYKLLETV